MNNYYIRINGTLTARGTSTDNIYFNTTADGYIEFTSTSIGWNSQTNTGNIIENAIVSSRIRTTEASLLINNNTITKSISLAGGSPIVSKNSITIATGSDWLGRPVYPSSAISISNALFGSSQSTAQIVDNIILGSFDHSTISIGGGSPTIERNIISNSYGYGGDSGYWQSGISISNNAHPTITQNTITKCANGISISGNPTPTISNNNIQNITGFNLRMEPRTVNIDATNNWWGTTDVQVINQSIYDFKNDFNLGTVNFVPFLTEPNPQATPDPNTPPPTQTTPPSPTPTIPETNPAVAALTLTVVTVGCAIVFRRRNRSPRL